MDFHHSFAWRQLPISRYASVRLSTWYNDGVATDWQSAGSVSWDRPWTQAGGDIVAETEPSIYSLKSESGLKEMTIDVTELVRSWKAGKLANNGILLTISKDDLLIDKPSVAFNLDDIAMRVFYSIEYK